MVSSLEITDKSVLGEGSSFDTALTDPSSFSKIISKRMK